MHNFNGFHQFTFTIIQFNDGPSLQVAIYFVCLLKFYFYGSLCIKSSEFFAAFRSDNKIKKYSSKLSKMKLIIVRFAIRIEWVI